MARPNAEWAAAIADDVGVLDLISRLPRTKQQPTLVFAAARFLGAPVRPYGPFREWEVTNCLVWSR